MIAKNGLVLTLTKATFLKACEDGRAYYGMIQETVPPPYGEMRVGSTTGKLLPKGGLLGLRRTPR
jgi:hypothetical protein